MPVQDRQFDRRMVSGAVAALPQPLREHRHQHHADQHMQAMKTGRDVVDEEEQLFAAAAVEAMAGPQVFMDLVAPLLAVQAEIGSASCRERVWQYVWTSGVAVTLKKQNNNDSK